MQICNPSCISFVFLMAHTSYHILWEKINTVNTQEGKNLL